MVERSFEVTQGGGCRVLPIYLIKSYMGAVEGCLLEHPEVVHPSDFSFIDPTAEWMRDRAASRGELDVLVDLLDYVLRLDDDELERRHGMALVDLVQDEDCRDDDVIRSIVRRVRGILSARPPRPDLDKVEVSGSAVGDWRAGRGE